MWHGTGTFTDTNGNVYIGGWKEGKRDGNGKWCTDRYVYEGEFKDGKRCGHRKETWPDGKVYVREVYGGQWKGGKKHGTGTTACKDGSMYAGEWKDNKKHGSGTFTDANGDKFKRTYIDDQLVSDKKVATLVNGLSSCGDTE